MRIQDITLTNFRLYKGTNKISFPEDVDGKNIYLISGENGFGMILNIQISLLLSCETCIGEILSCCA